MTTDRSPEELRWEREKRVSDAIQLKVPDRVPIVTTFGYFPAKYADATCKDAWYDYDRWLAAYKKTVRDFEPDMVFTQSFVPGEALERLDPMQIDWPGHGVSPDHSHQSIEGEFMEADEYDAFLADQTDFMIRLYWPRICGALKHLATVPQISSMGFSYRGVLMLAEALAAPDVADALESLLEAGKTLAGWRAKMDAFNNEIEQLGFPLLNRAMAQAPFDVVSDFLRGMQGTMLDMFRQPDKLTEACEKLCPQITSTAISVAKRSGNPRVFMPLHRGAHGFMSLQQFETFYWPTLNKVILSLVDEGLTPCVFFEGDYTSRLEYLLELPRGKILGHFDTTDVFKAKEVLKDHMCIRGNVPPSLLQAGTPQDVKDYCKRLIDVVGKDGGLMMAPRSSVDEVNPRNFKTMFDFTREYGVYT